MSARPKAAFYCVADERYFLGAVAMINSLRHHGHDEPIYLLDCGLSAAQRALVAAEVTIVDAPDETPPYLLKTIVPLRHPAEVMVLIDADMIVTRPLAELIEVAAAGRVVAFENNSDRHVAAWGELLDLGPLRHGTYVSSGFAALGGDFGAEVLALLGDRQRRVDFSETFYGRNHPEYPFLYPEQDVLNAILYSFDAARTLALEHRLAPNQPFAGLSIRAGEGRVAYEDGSEPYLLHHFLKKPWLEPMYHGIYSQLLVRMVLADDAAIRLDAGQLPLRMRPGALAWLERKRVDLTDLARWYARDVIPERRAARRAATDEAAPR